MTKSKKYEKCKTILHNSILNTPITNSQNIEFLIEIFKTHKNWEYKKGVGVKLISVIQTKYRTKCFQITRLDNSKTDISFKEAIYPISKNAELMLACRSAIQPTIKQYKEANFINNISKCSITNEQLNEKNVEVDHHDLTFQEIFKLWISKFDKAILYTKINDTTIDGETEIFFTDKMITKDFIEYHNQNTNLRLVSRYANRSILKTRINKKE